MKSTIPFLLLAALGLFAAWPARADPYRGNGDTGFGGAIGNGTLTLSDDGTNISGTLTVGGSMNDVLVLYIQSGPGGFADTAGFNDQGDYRCQAISGVSASGRSVLSFASGFRPNYAIALGPSAVESGSLWQLANGGNGSLVNLGSVNLAPPNDTGPYTFSFPAALIGMIPGVRSTIQVFGTYVRTDGSRSTESIAGDLTGTQGWNPFTQTAYGGYTFDAGAVLIKLPVGLWAQRTSSSSPVARRYHTAVWTGSEMIVWGGQNGGGALNDGGRYNPAANTWTTLPTIGAPAKRLNHSAVWTGSEMIVWAGMSGTGYSNDGGRYNPTANSWASLPTTGAPTGRDYHTAVWTGSEMIVWGGYGYIFSTFTGQLNDGGRYNPALNSWAIVTATGAPAARSGHTAVWTGTEMVIWGGAKVRGYYNDGGRYDPAANTWTAIPTNGAPSERFSHTAVWTGTEMITWGGYNASTSRYLNNGGRYNPAADRWAALSTIGAPGPRQYHTAVWTGSEMVVWGGFNNGTPYADGGRYNPVGNSWTAVPSADAPVARYFHTAVWTGSEMILFGGDGGSSQYLSDTWSYSPYAPAVRIARLSPFSADVVWPVWYPTLRLSQTTNLAAGEWTTVTNAITQVGAENHVTISPLSGTQFFRAESP